MKELQYPVRPGRYRHFKGNEYQVLGVARHSETEEEMVVYRALYGEGGLWVRPGTALPSPALPISGSDAPGLNPVIDPRIILR